MKRMRSGTVSALLLALLVLRRRQVRQAMREFTAPWRWHSRTVSVRWKNV